MPSSMGSGAHGSVVGSEALEPGAFANAYQPQVGGQGVNCMRTGMKCRERQLVSPALFLAPRSALCHMIMQCHMALRRPPNWGLAACAATQPVVAGPAPLPEWPCP